MESRPEHCPSCGKPATGSEERCIFCWKSLAAPQAVTRWRDVYHAASSADALLANSTLASYGLTTRIRDEHFQRLMLGAAGGVVQVAEEQHLTAKEVLRQVRGVRTDTEYLEWQALKQRGAKRRRRAKVALALAVSVFAAGLFGGIEGCAALARAALAEFTDSEN